MSDGPILIAGSQTLSTRTQHRLAEGAPNASAPTSGYHLAFVIGARLVAPAIAAAVIVLATRAKAAEDMPDAEPAVRDRA